MSARAATPAPAVTIVMCWRERHSTTQQALEALRRHTRAPYALVVLDLGMPAPLRAALPALIPDAATIVRDEAAAWPTEARARIAGALRTPFAVFMDNDAIVHPGWLEHLLACAQATGAGIVSPLVLTGAHADVQRIHFAGGDLEWLDDPAAAELRDSHRLSDRQLAQVAAGLRAQPCDFAEFHCMLMRREVYAAPGVFDPRIHCVHEHIHAALRARQLGYPIWVEPAARVTYLAGVPLRVGELAGFRRRWSREAGERSIQAFCATWGVRDSARSFGGVRAFLADHAARVDPLRPGAPQAAQASAPMGASDLRQTLAGLLGLAAERGYGEDDLAALRRAYWEVLVLMDGGYRPCGRPFVNHLAGCASVLLHYGFATRIVVAALHHATYSHFPDPGRGRTADLLASVRKAGRRGVPPGRERRSRRALRMARAAWRAGIAPLRGGRHPEALARAAAAVLGGRGSALEQAVRAYTLRGARWAGRTPEDWTQATVDEAEVLMIAAANDVDMALAGEIRLTGRADTLGTRELDAARASATALGVPGLALTIERSCAGAPAAGRPAQSFRLRRGRAVAMVRWPPLVRPDDGPAPQRAGAGGRA